MAALCRYGCVGSFLDTFPPSEIVLPYTLENGGLHTVLSNSDHNLIKFIKRQHYNDNKGKEMIRHIATAESCSVELEVGDSYLALAAFHALLKYTQFGKAPAADDMQGPNDAVHKVLQISLAGGYHVA